MDKANRFYTYIINVFEQGIMLLGIITAGRAGGFLYTSKKDFTPVKSFLHYKFRSQEKSFIK